MKTSIINGSEVSRLSVAIQTDLDVLLSSDYRRAVLEITAHTLLQHSTLKGNDRFTQKDFDNLVAVTLHASLALLHIFISRVSREHNIAIDHYVEEILHRRTRRG
ncbi:hypothetical protein ACLEXY_11765 [Enterobacter ludwigii]|uniref:hypothetical protein n=1 Tax=Enterobacter ludwigii TaxID=299767 RepID=UPI0006434D76|nr:hypothetical protein [Enterobacter ludwigii]MDR6366270.1 hypothetical protein [Enterobacter sp. SORGH_AS_0287]KLR48371.1 hypothetical protein ABR23_01880 [Enterobacter ludwigii]CAH0266122.1 hypothetical protein SRABI45_03389 [Enterobacter ludwigii]VAG33321.1 Uncharacterised protein [Enterobacter ludwigii]VAG75207.1 Uncharacterised protein [Enterobacter ludwigii]